MGTFHDNKGELHGITVLVETDTGVTFVGRCDTQTPDAVILLDVADHTEGESDLSKQDWIKNAAKWGVFPSHKSLSIPAAAVTKITPLGQVEV